MTLNEFRKQYSEYDDISDEDVLALVDFDAECNEPDNVVPALFDIEKAVNELCATVEKIKIPDSANL